MSRFWGWQGPSALCVLVALLGCGETTRDSPDAGGSAASGGSTPNHGGSDSGLTGGAVSSGGSTGSGGQSGSGLLTDVQGIAGLSFTANTGSCLRYAERQPGIAMANCKWTFHFRAIDKGLLELIAYSDPLELISQARLENQGDTWVLISGGLSLPTPSLSTELEVSALEFRFFDQDGDGRADSARADGPATLFYEPTDAIDSFPASYFFQGAPDMRNPELAASVRVSPSEFLRFAASEPLTAESRATLTVGSEVIALEPKLEFGVTRSFSAAHLLWPDSEAELHVEGSDLAGNPIDAQSQVRVSSIPAETSLDFESEAPFLAQSSGATCNINASPGARESYDALTALEGQRSFLVAWGSRVLLHVKRPAGTSTLRLSLRTLSMSADDGPDIQVMVLGGTRIERQVAAVPIIGEDNKLPPGATALFSGIQLPAPAIAAAMQELAFSLEEQGEDVLVSIDAPCLEGAPSQLGAWLDDLRFE
jgi:hypothetical protein